MLYRYSENPFNSTLTKQRSDESGEHSRCLTRTRKLSQSSKVIGRRQMNSDLLTDCTAEVVPTANQSDDAAALSDYNPPKIEPFTAGGDSAPLPIQEKSFDHDACLLPETIYHDMKLIAEAEVADNMVLICETFEAVTIMGEFGIPAVATPSGEWTMKDCQALRQAGFGQNLCLYSTDADWIYATAKALGESYTTDAPLIAEPTGETNLSAVYARINNPAASLPIYDWQAERERRRNRLLPAPYDLSRNVAMIPRTDFIYGPHYIRREVSITVAAAGTGKSFLTLTEAVAMASGRNLLGQDIAKPASIWYWTEDHLNDAELRLRAVMALYGVTVADIGDRIRLSSFRDTKLKLATPEKGQVKIDRARVEEIAKDARDVGIDVIVFDTLKKTHSLNENSNPEMDTLFDEFIYIAEYGQCAVEIVHHMGKSGDRNIDMNSLRGASSILGSVRAGRFLCRMTANEGEKAGVDNHKAYFSVECGKSNKSADNANKQWFHLSGRDMANGENVGTLSQWQWPDSFDNISNDDATAILDTLSAKPMRASDQCVDWAGHTVADHLDLDLTVKFNRSKVKTILSTWLSNGMIEKRQGKDANRKPVPFLHATGKHIA